MRLQGMKTFPNTGSGYQEAEKFADQWAGDCIGYAVIVEDYENDKLHVMDESDAQGFLAEQIMVLVRTGENPQVIYRADHRAHCHACENLITGQKITCRGRDYCSFACLDKEMSA